MKGVIHAACASGFMVSTNTIAARGPAELAHRTHPVHAVRTGISMHPAAIPGFSRRLAGCTICCPV